MAAKTDFDALMHVVCAEWCLGSAMTRNGARLDVTRFIPETGPVSADQFVEWVFLASNEEQRDPKPMWQRARVAIRAAFVRHMGGETVDATALRWGVAADGTVSQLPITDPAAFARNLTDDELLDREGEFGADWRDRIIARNELARRHARPLWAQLLGGAVGLACLAYWVYRFFDLALFNDH